jgi:magnesium-transporting ATPase (P-type)
VIAPARPKDAFYADAPAEVALALESDEQHGLSQAEAGNRLHAFGPNSLGRVEGPSYARIAGRQLADPLVGLLLAAAAISAMIGERFEAGVIAAIVVLNAVLGFFQEAGAERALLALSRAVELPAAVVRGGRERMIAAAELVPGDLIFVREGDQVPADARVVASEWLAVDESALTGESAAVERPYRFPSGRHSPSASRCSMRALVPRADARVRS